MGARARDTVEIRSGLRGPYTVPAPLAPFAANQATPIEHIGKLPVDVKSQHLAPNFGILPQQYRDSFAVTD
jgi:hypothetical protein